MKTLISLALLYVLAPVAAGEDYRCAKDCGCDAKKNEDGTLVTTSFRKGDMVQTEAGWIVSTDDGWEKLKPEASPSSLRGLPTSSLPHGNVPTWIPSTTDVPECSDGSTWIWGGTVIVVHISETSTGNVSFAVEDARGTSGAVPGVAGATSTSTNPTCKESDTATATGGRQYRVHNGKPQRRNRLNQWVDLRHIRDKGPHVVESK